MSSGNSNSSFIAVINAATSASAWEAFRKRKFSVVVSLKILEKLEKKDYVQAVMLVRIFVHETQ